MKQIYFGVALLVPTVLSAQVNAQGQASSRTAATVTAPDPQASAQARARANANAAFNAPERFSATGKVKLAAMYADAQKEGLPPEPMAKRVAEGEAKGASEGAIIAAAARVKTQLEASQTAMVAAGHPKPTPEECERGAMLMARGVTSAQIETMARHTPSDRSLVVAFDVVSRLAAQGLPVTQAVARVQAKIDGRASDATLLTLATNATGAAGVGVAASGGAAASGRANATAQGTANAATKPGATGTVGAVAGAAVGVLKKP